MCIVLTHSETRSKMKLEDMRKVIATHPDFKNEKSILERFINSRGHAVLFIPKYHCELNANKTIYVWIRLGHKAEVEQL